MATGFSSEDFRVRHGEKVKLKEWPTSVVTRRMPVTKAVVRYFDHADAAEARAWLDEA